MRWGGRPRRHHDVPRSAIAGKPQEPSITEIARIAIAASKSVFTLHGVDASGRAVLRQNLRAATISSQ